MKAKIEKAESGKQNPKQFCVIDPYQFDGDVAFGDSIEILAAEKEAGRFMP